MGLFSKRAPSCDMCGRTEAEGCGSAHAHVERIGAQEPSWLPEQLRAQAPGEYTWLCVRCHSFPSMKWPGEGGAWASMVIHLGKAHHVGQFASTGARMPTEFSMLPVP